MTMAEQGNSAVHLRNRILAALSAPEYQRLRAAGLELLMFAPRHVLFDVDESIKFVYFPEDCVASIVGVMADGSAVETATVGNEGMVGLPLFLGADRMPAQAFCQIAGHAFRLPAAAFREALGQSSALRDVLGRYTQALFTQVAQSSACNRRHNVQQRCARWLLQSQDRVGRDEFPLTQQFLSQMLGVRRATVTEVAGALQTVGLIDYTYGRITIRDRPGLEAASCECYEIIRREYARLLEGLDLPSPLDSVTTEQEGKSTLGDAMSGADADE
jgi:CRP-like cAMP-binding protein